MNSTLPIDQQDQQQEQKQRCAIYARVSLDRQSESVEHQVSLLREYVKQKKLGEIPDEYIYEDSGVSATKYSIWTRPAMKRLLEDAKQGKFQVVLFKGISRFARNTQEALDVLDRLKARGLRVISYEENYDSARENSNFTFTIHSAVAEYEAEKMGIRVRLGMKENAKEGKWQGRAPYGYRIENGKLVPVEEEAEVVRRIFDLYVNKEYGGKKIAEILNLEGIRRPTGALWTRKKIVDLIKNEAYIGNVVYNKTRVVHVRNYDNPEEEGKKKAVRKPNDEKDWVRVENAHPAIVDKRIFYEAQELRKKKSERCGKVPNAYHPLSGILYCGKCGRTMNCQVRRYKHYPKKAYRYYVCKTYQQYGRAFCDQKNIKADRIEVYVINKLVERLEQALSKQDVPVEKSQAEIEKLKKELESVERKIEKAKKDTADLYFERDKLAEEAYNFIAEKLKNELKRLNEQRDRLENQIRLMDTSIEDTIKIKQYMKEFLTLQLDDARLRVLLHKLIERIEATDDHLDITYNFVY